MELLSCNKSCLDVNPGKHFQNIKTEIKNIRMVMVSEAMPRNLDDYFDGNGVPIFIKNTNMLFNQIGYNHKTYNDYLDAGIYLTTAIKCVKQNYLVSAKTIEECSFLLEEELEPFSNIKVIMLMGDFAIKAINYIWKRKYQQKIIPNGATYKIRNEVYTHSGIRFLPSYTQTGDSFGIEKSKIEMMKEDIKKGMELLK
jgi:uracil-DNA glycosylase